MPVARLELVIFAVDDQDNVLSLDVPCFTNGLAVSPDGRWLWVVESYEPRLSRFDLAAGDGRAELVRRFDGTVLDGLACTADGGLLVSCYRPDRIYHFSPSGAVEIRWHSYARNSRAAFSSRSTPVSSRGTRRPT